MPWLTDPEYERLKRESSEVRELRALRDDVLPLVAAAAKCGFTDANQEDALMFALTKILKEPASLVRLLLHVKPKGYRGR